MEDNLTADVDSFYAGVRIANKYYQRATGDLLDNRFHIAQLLPCAGVCSTAVTGVGVNGEYKSAALQFVSFDRREDAPESTGNLNRRSLLGKYIFRATGYVVLVR